MAMRGTESSPSESLPGARLLSSKRSELRAALPLLLLPPALPLPLLLPAAARAAADSAAPAFAGLRFLAVMGELAGEAACARDELALCDAVRTRRGVCGGVERLVLAGVDLGE